MGFLISPKWLKFEELEAITLIIIQTFFFVFSSTISSSSPAFFVCGLTKNFVKIYPTKNKII
jgi:hypothetical protein